MKMIKKEVKVIWDVQDCTPEECNLPYIVTIPDNIEEENISDWLSDEYGYCVKSYS